ncbi:MAG: 2-oxoglutarate dehydrogenase E1 component [Gammaproteobacteria bacterium]|nr:2-oxoglutarate dehydrogenase E1 component [Gammaproteobacteria bacterium]
MSREKIINNMHEKWLSSFLSAGSAAWVEAIYEDYLRDPNAVDTQWRVFFETLPAVNGQQQPDIAHSAIKQEIAGLSRQSRRIKTDPQNQVSLEYERKQVRVLQLINAYRFRGHQWAAIDPLQRQQKIDIPELDLHHHQLSAADMETVFETGSLVGVESASLETILDILQRTYCGSIGAEYMHSMETDEKRWIQQRLESVCSTPAFSHEERIKLYQRLIAAEGLEKYLHTKYVGQKRFSLEGGESLIPLLDTLVERAGVHGVTEMVIGMAHRGRLNVLVNIMGKTPAELFQEFEGKKSHGDSSGDVKYHQGFSSDVQTSGGSMHLALAFNPSHLEIVAPVVEGAVRARQERNNDLSGNKIIPVQIHGDAAFSGQGVVMETLQMSQSRGYSTKGTLHIIINNQIGFTTSNQQDARSTHYCTDIAKMVNAPIFHVNADDPEAVLLVTQMALDYRMSFKKDVVIDMVCYRRHGHNEADEPAATQPMMYKTIRNLETTPGLYAKKLIEQGMLTAADAEKIAHAYRDDLDAGFCVVPNMLDNTSHSYFHGVEWDSFDKTFSRTYFKTNISAQSIRELAEQLDKLPEKFELHSRVAKIKSDRMKMSVGAKPIDWGFGEIMAYASLVNEGYNVRLSGQDCGRGTFFHRHAVYHNQLKAEAYVPLRNISASQGNFLVIDSLLSEEAVLAFEYGYSTADPASLVIWEAQFGDFANGAQVVIDQFISAGEQKWGRMCGLVMLLPHGYEGQGPEHSSARPERYLQLCAEDNMQVCVPSTPAQVFHMLRRQVVRPSRKPLICMSPKSLLRHKMAVSQLEEFTEGRGFKTVLPETDQQDASKVNRVVLCSGKVYYDLLQKREEGNCEQVAIIRLEQLYPFPFKTLGKTLSEYEHVNELIWCQEEPKNQGAWDFCKPRFARLYEGKKQPQILFAGRPPSAAPAVGSAVLHAKQQHQLVCTALGLALDEES